MKSCGMKHDSNFEIFEREQFDYIIAQKNIFLIFFLFYQPNKNVAINRQIYLRGECCTRG